MKTPSEKFKIAAADFETTPFKFGRVPKPFCFGFKTRDNYYSEWAEEGEPCAKAFVDYIQKIKEPHIIYFHNGGRFDVLFLSKYINPERITMIDGRVVSCRIGIHEIRDSMAIFPMALKSAIGKDAFDYSKLEKENRDKYRDEILGYLKSDCEYLLSLMLTFVAQTTTERSRTIPRTAAGAAYKQLLKTCPQPLNISPKNPEQAEKWLQEQRDHDAYFRQYYKGGRVQPFEFGVLEGAFTLYDVNSMYPAVMKNYPYPRGRKYTVLNGGRLNSDGWVAGFKGQMYFIHFKGECSEIPWKDEVTKKTYYSKHEGEFFLCSHELRAAMILGKVRIDEVLEIRIPAVVQSFGAHVDKFYSLRKTEGVNDKALDTYFKLCLNAPYGRFAYDWRNYSEQIFDNCDGSLDYAALKKGGWRESETYCDEDGLLECRILEHDNTRESYLDVAIGAAITSAARAELMMAIASAKRPIYCDTDSLLCEGLGEGVKTGKALGEWKLELECDRAAISGRKLYALFKGEAMIKDASKGVRLTPKQHLHIAANPGEFATYEREAPTMRLGKKPVFITRRVRRV